MLLLYFLFYEDASVFFLCLYKSGIHAVARYELILKNYTVARVDQIIQYAMIYKLI